MALAAVHSELQLLFACAQLSPDQALIHKLASEKLHWHNFALAAEFHGLSPLVLKNLQAAGISLPTEVAQEMAEWNAATVRQNLFLTSELLRVRGVLSKRGVEAVPLKGAALASQLYGDLGLRPFSDIDLLIRREQIQEAESGIKGVGYEPEFTIPPQHRKQWLRQQCELTFRRGGTIRLELHWDIAHPHFALDTGVDEFWPRLATVRIGEATLPNFSPSDLLFTLILHGTRHAWSRMMWMVDIAELLRRDSGIDWKEFWCNAQARRAARLVATGLILARDAFGVSVADSALQRVYTDRVALGLADQVTAHWNKHFEGIEREAEPAPLWRHRWIMHSREKRAQRWAYARNVLMMVGDEEFATVRLPRVLTPLYKVVRLWNIFRKCRPQDRAAAARSKI